MESHVHRVPNLPQRHFVGRLSEQRLFENAITAPTLPFRVLYVFGPGGIGKSSLLRSLLEMCNDRQIPAACIDARSVEPGPDAFLGAVRIALDAPDGRSLAEVLSDAHRSVLMIDTYEILAPLDHWVREHFIPELPETVMVVVATRTSPTPEWRLRGAWQPAIHILPLRNLDPDDTQMYLRLRRIPDEQRHAVHTFTHGHPLALSLVADVFDQRPDFHFHPEEIPDVIAVLLEHLVQKVPGPAHRSALEACSLVRVMTQSLLADMLKLPDVYELFEWLHSLSFIETRRGGIFPHDLVREVLSTELRWRHPDWYAELRRRAREHYLTHVQQTTGTIQQRALMDYIYLHRDNPMVKPFFEWQASGSILPDVLHASSHDDVPALLALVADHEGEEAAAFAAHWFARQPHNVLVFRDSDGEPAGLLIMVALHEAAPADIAIDPGIHAAWQYLQQQAPLRHGEAALHFRFWLACDSYQDVSPVQTLLFVTMVRQYLTVPRLAFTFLPCADPDFWAPVLTYADLTRLPAADFEVGGRRYGVYGHDWRVVPPLAWLDVLATRETDRLIVLSEADFGAAIKETLRHLMSPYQLRDNPLLYSRLVTDLAGPDADIDARSEVLRRQIGETIALLDASPREQKLYRALYCTFLHPAPSQEKAAELLDLPFSTYRRHLKAGIERITTLLWERELGNTPLLSEK